MTSIRYSWILPVKDEALSLPQLFKEISTAMKDKSYEIIAINDASTDHTPTTLTSLTSQIPQLKIISFSSHQGKWASLQAGFKKASGKIIITSDSDLQDDPKELYKLLNKLEPPSSLRGMHHYGASRGNLYNQGYDLVSGARVIRFDPFYKVLISKLGNFLVSIITDHHFQDLNSSFKVYKREVFDEIPKQGSMLRFSLLFADRLGYRSVEVPVNHRSRLFGKSKFGVVKYLRILYDLILVLLLFTGSGRLRKP